MQLADKLKQKGNECFDNGDTNGAELAYRQAIEAMMQEVGRSGGAAIEGSRELLAVLNSNLSNVYLSQGHYDKSWEVAQEATLWDPTFAKGWLRYVYARRLAGYPFEAFVALLRYLRPLLRCHASSSSSSPSSSSSSSSSCTSGITLRNLEEVEGPLYRDLGLSMVLPHVELQDCEGGVGIVARRAIKPNEVILVEKRFDTAFLGMELSSQTDLTTAKIVTYFAKRILPHQLEKSETWVRFKKQFKGCWPRRPEDISADTRSEISHSLRAELPEMCDDDFEDLFSVALMCRYNCFYSGMFRTCALANHSCCANAAMKPSRNDTVTLIAVLPIAAGELVNVKYLSDAQFLMGVGKRREYLRSWLFWCRCDRCCLDNTTGATQEQVQCNQCHQYTHLPLSSEATGSKDDDPLIPQEASCTHCRATVRWSAESRATVDQLMLSFNDVRVCTTPHELRAWLLCNLQRVAALRVHPEHWLHRIVLYFFCVPITSAVSDIFNSFCRLGWQTPQLEALLLSDVGVQRFYADIFANNANNDINNRKICIRTSSSGGTGLAAAEMGGGDALWALCALWRFISSFYPHHEGWALHRAICHLVLFAHTHPNESAALDGSLALTLLCRHGKYIGDTDASLWLQAYNQHKPAGHRKELLSTKLIKSAFHS